jgi:hypothetical protein
MGKKIGNCQYTASFGIMILCFKNSVLILMVASFKNIMNEKKQNKKRGSKGWTITMIVN